MKLEDQLAEMVGATISITDTAVHVAYMDQAVTVGYKRVDSISKAIITAVNVMAADIRKGNRK